MEEILQSFVPISKVIVAGKLADGPLSQTRRDVPSVSPNEKAPTKSAFHWKPVEAKASTFYPRVIEQDDRPRDSAFAGLMQTSRLFASATPPREPEQPVVRENVGWSGSALLREQGNGSATAQVGRPRPANIDGYFGKTTEWTRLSPMASRSPTPSSPSPEIRRPPPSKYQKRIAIIDRDDRDAEQARNKRRARVVAESDIEETDSEEEEVSRKRERKKRVRPSVFIDDEAEEDEEEPPRAPKKKRRTETKVGVQKRKKCTGAKGRKLYVSSDDDVEEVDFAKFLSNNSKPPRYGLMNPFFAK